MELNSSVLKIDFFEVEKIIKNFIKKYIEENNFKGIILGLSGGIDSCTVAALASSAIGGEKITGLILPEKETYSIVDIKDAKIIADKFHIKVEVHDLTKILDNLYKNLPSFNHKKRVTKGNIKARIRMLYLYYYANSSNKLVCGTSDKSETMIGYFTKWGDGAADIAPIIGLYKTQVQKLALHLGIPKKIAEKPPSPNLWKKQSAEAELGINYELLDLILFGLEQNMKINQIAYDLKIDKSIVQEIKNRVNRSRHKRSLPKSVNLI